MTQVTPSSDAKFSQWQLAENSPEAYERYLVPIIFAPWAERLIDLARPRLGERVLDVACGTGIVARRAASHVGRSGSVVGVDTNANMLEVARAASQDIRPAIEWRQGDVKKLPCADEDFDVVFCQQALQFFPDRLTALSEMRRVLKPQGRLALSVFRSTDYNPGYKVLAELLERHAGAEAGVMMRSPFPSWPRSELRHLVSRAGFSDIRIQTGVASERFPSIEEFLRQEAASSPLAGPIGELSEEIREELIGDLGRALEMYTDDEGIVFPVETNLLLAQRQLEPG